MAEIKRCDFMRMARKASLSFFFALAVLWSPAPGNTYDITTLNFRQTGRDIILNAYLQLDEKMIDELNSGLSKEIVFNIELFRYRKIWRNEFIAGKSLTRLLQSNPIKREYVGTNIDEKEKTVRRFKDINSMIAWGVRVEELVLRDLEFEEDSDYFIRVSAEARMHTLPAVVGYILFFLPTREFSVSEESELFKYRPPRVNK